MRKSRNKIVVGCDIVNLPHFRKVMAEAGQVFLERIFTNGEMKKRDPSHLGGIFAAKEAAIKALKLKAGSWQKLEVVYQKNGKPILKFKNLPSFKIKTADLSISHNGDYVISVFVAILA